MPGGVAAPERVPARAALRQVSAAQACTPGLQPIRPRRTIHPPSTAGGTRIAAPSSSICGVGQRHDAACGCSQHDAAHHVARPQRPFDAAGAQQIAVELGLAESGALHQLQPRQRFGGLVRDRSAASAKVPVDAELTRDARAGCGYDPGPATRPSSRLPCRVQTAPRCLCPPGDAPASSFERRFSPRCCCICCCLA